MTVIVCPHSMYPHLQAILTECTCMFILMFIVYIPAIVLTIAQNPIHPCSHLPRLNMALRNQIQFPSSSSIFQIQFLGFANVSTVKTSGFSTDSPPRHWETSTLEIGQPPKAPPATPGVGFFCVQKLKGFTGVHLGYLNGINWRINQNGIYDDWVEPPGELGKFERENLNGKFEPSTTWEMLNEINWEPIRSDKPMLFLKRFFLMVQR